MKIALSSQRVRSLAVINKSKQITVFSLATRAWHDWLRWNHVIARTSSDWPWSSRIETFDWTAWITVRAVWVLLLYLIHFSTYSVLFCCSYKSSSTVQVIFNLYLIINYFFLNQLDSGLWNLIPDYRVVNRGVGNRGVVNRGVVNRGPEIIMYYSFYSGEAFNTISWVLYT